MILFLLSAANALPQEVENLDSDPAFRRATLGMKLAAHAAGKLLNGTSAIPDRERLAVSVGTDLGELSATYAFLRGIALEQAARPLAFQNSLHHSTLGFLSRLFRLTGPGITVSHRNASGTDALSAAAVLLTQGSEMALVVEVEAFVPELHERLRPNQTCPKSRATALLVSAKPRSENCREIDTEAKGNSLRSIADKFLESR